MDAEGLRSAVFSRRSALKAGAATAFLLSQAALLEQLASPVARADSAPAMFPDIQFDLGAFINPAEVLQRRRRERHASSSRPSTRCSSR